MKVVFIALILFCTALNASSKYPVDISYLVADLKYSQEHGIKICEIQHGILSTLYGDTFVNESYGLLSPQIQKIFAEFPIPKWSIPNHISFSPLISVLEGSPDWDEKSSFTRILMDPNFSKCSKSPPENPTNIAAYNGMIFARKEAFKNYDRFHKNHPGIIVIDAATHPYWIDKYKMSFLFNLNPALSKIKPEWNLYTKQYTTTLAQQIQNDISSDTYVIKPRGGFLGNGVIIIAKECLDSTLKYILDKESGLKDHPDLSYRHWNKDPFDSLIVEKYYPSDPIQVEALGNKIYEPTMRVAFILIYNHEAIDFRFLGGYWLLPVKAIDENGTLNELKKAYCKTPFYSGVADDILDSVREELEITMPLLYQEMLEKN